MKRSRVLFAVAATLFVASGVAAQPDSSAAQPTSPIEVTSMLFCTAVQDREPVGESAAFAEDVGTVCCITRITGVEGESTVTHVWYEGDTEVSRVELPVRAASWRTWSCKTISASGSWRVEVQSADGSVLRSGTFTVGAAAGQ